MGGIRGRLAAALVALVAITVLAIGVGTYLFVDARLRDGLLADANRQVQFDLTVLVPNALPRGATSQTFEASGLPAALRLRGGVEEIVVFGDDEVYVSAGFLADTLGALPADLRSVVARGEIGYAWVELGGAPSLVIGSRAPATDGVAGPEMYFVFPAGAIDTALGQLRLGLAVVAGLALFLAVLLSRAIATRILRPVASGGLAAARIAAGDLSARVPVEGSDELAAFAAEFNQMADALASTITRLEASERENRRFVADVAHELRTPLTALVAEAALIEGDLDRLAPQARRAAELLVADVRRLHVLVEDLMELSRFDAGVEAVDVAPVDLAAAVGRIIAARHSDARLAVPPERILLESDIRRLDRIVGNLLDNARVHAPGSPVDVSVQAAPGGATVSVADRGPGASPEVMAHLFDRFYKGDPSRRTGSSGIGLAIAAEHARLLGGTLSAAPRPGGGLVFTLFLPVTNSLPAGDGPVLSGVDDPIVPRSAADPA